MTSILLRIGGAFFTNWTKIKILFRGKKIAVLGPRSSGKTTLLQFLVTGELPREYIQTGKPEKLSGRMYKLEDLELIIKDTLDVPGDKLSHTEWERLCQEADIVCYLVDASKLHKADQDYQKNAQEDVRHIRAWHQARKSAPPKFCLVATHCDLIPDYSSLPRDRKADFSDEFWKKDSLQRIINLGGGSGYVKCVLGSLKDRTNTEILVGNIFNEVTI